MYHQGLLSLHENMGNLPRALFSATGFWAVLRSLPQDSCASGASQVEEEPRDFLKDFGLYRCKIHVPGILGLQ